jgi:PPOX class probable F420-dependent enzyme
MERIPESHYDLFEKKAFGHLATIMADGTPQVTPVWVSFDGEHILVNTARGRLKDRNVERNPYVAIDIIDPENPYRYVAIRGPVVETTEEGAREHINQLSQHYNGTYPYPGPQTETRVILKIAPEHVLAAG